MLGQGIEMGRSSGFQLGFTALFQGQAAHAVQYEQHDLFVAGLDQLIELLLDVHVRVESGTANR